MNTGFGDEFKEMSDREILVSLYKDVQALNVVVGAITRHTTILGIHDNRIQSLENLISKKDSRKQDKYIIYALVISAVAGWGGLLIAVADIVTHGG